MYDAAMDRITRWVPELKAHFERAAAKDKVGHKPLAKGAFALQRGRFAPIVRSLKTFHAWRAEHPAVYDAAMDRITMLVPALKDHLERAAAKARVKHKPPASLEERAAADKQRRDEQWASAKASRCGNSAPPSFARKRKCRDEAPAGVTKQAPWPRVPKQLHNCGAKGCADARGGSTV